MVRGHGMSPASGNLRTQMRLNSRARGFSHSHAKETIVNRLIASLTLLTVVAGLTGCVVAPGYDYGYAQPYYPDYGYAYGPPYAPVYGSVGIYGGWGGGCCHGGHWHGGDGWHGGNGWHGDGGWHGNGGSGGWHGSGFGGSHDGSSASGGGSNSWTSGGMHGGGRSH